MCAWFVIFGFVGGNIYLRELRRKMAGLNKQSPAIYDMNVIHEKIVTCICGSLSCARQVWRTLGVLGFEVKLVAVCAFFILRNVKE